MIYHIVVLSNTQILVINGGLIANTAKSTWPRRPTRRKRHCSTERQFQQINNIRKKKTNILFTPNSQMMHLRIKMSNPLRLASNNPWDCSKKNNNDFCVCRAKAQFRYHQLLISFNNLIMMINTMDVAFSFVQECTFTRKNQN